jgi:hypothetical protein
MDPRTTFCPSWHCPALLVGPGIALVACTTAALDAPPRSAGVPRMRSSAWLNDGAETTVRCGATD